MEARLYSGLRAVPALPLAEARVVRPEVFRAAEQAETKLPPFSGFTVIELMEPPSASIYSVRLAAAEGGAIVWRRDGLAAERDGVLAVALPPGIPAGRFRLIVEERDASGRLAPAGNFALRFE